MSETPPLLQHGGQEAGRVATIYRGRDSAEATSRNAGVYRDRDSAGATGRNAGVYRGRDSTEGTGRNAGDYRYRDSAEATGRNAGVYRGRDPAEGTGRNPGDYRYRDFAEGTGRNAGVYHRREIVKGKCLNAAVDRDQDPGPRSPESAKMNVPKKSEEPMKAVERVPDKPICDIKVKKRIRVSEKTLLSGGSACSCFVRLLCTCCGMMRDRCRV